jgi:hypothetical protein
MNHEKLSGVSNIAYSVAARHSLVNKQEVINELY